MEIFDNIFVRIILGLIGVAFIIYWIQFLPISEIFRDLQKKIFKTFNDKSVDDLTIEENVKQIGEELKKKKLEKQG